tara:strand:+ start:808 stop:1110 length:303 start_codon:yes stop_codon:yes gene_type:complete
MNDFQALLIFVAVVIAISGVMVVILNQSLLDTINKSNNTKIRNKKSATKMKKEGLSLIREELMKRELERHYTAQRTHPGRSFVVYDAETGESINYYEKKR